MPIPILNTTKPKVVIIGGGISGLACAYKLSQSKKYEIHVYEKNEQLGGRLYDVFAGRVLLGEDFYPSTHWFTKELGLNQELDVVTPKDFGFILPTKKVISGSAVKFYLLKEFVFRQKNLKLFIEAFKFIRYIQTLKFDISKFDSNVGEKDELRNITFEEYRKKFSPDIQQLVLDPVQMMISPLDMGKINAELGIFFAWVIYAMKKGYFMSRAPKVYAEKFMEVAKKCAINIHLNSEVKVVASEAGKYQVISPGLFTEIADIVVCTSPLNITEKILNTSFGIEYSMMRGLLIKGDFKYNFQLSLSAYPETNVDLIYNWGEYQVVYPSDPWLNPTSTSKLPVSADIDFLYKGDWEFIKEFRSAGVPLTYLKKLPPMDYKRNLYLAGDFYSYTGLEAAVVSGVKAADMIMEREI